MNADKYFPDSSAQSTKRLILSTLRYRSGACERTSQLLIFSVLPWCTAFNFCENLGVIIGVRKTGHQSGFRDRTGRITEMLKTAFNPVFLDISEQSDVHAFFKETATFAGT